MNDAPQAVQPKLVDLLKKLGVANSERAGLIDSLSARITDLTPIGSQLCQPRCEEKTEEGFVGNLQEQVNKVQEDNEKLNYLLTILRGII